MFIVSRVWAGLGRAAWGSHCRFLVWMLRRLLLSSSFAFFLAWVLLAFAPSDGFFVRPVAATTTVSDDEGSTSTKQYQQVQGEVPLKLTEFTQACGLMI